MSAEQIAAKLWNLCNVLRDDGVTYHQYLNELTYILFIQYFVKKLSGDSSVIYKFIDMVLIFSRVCVNAEHINKSLQQ